MKTITMLEVRRNTQALVEGLARGETYLLTYRDRPIAELRPVVGPDEPLASDPVYRVAAHAEDLGEPLTAREADSLLYGG